MASRPYFGAIFGHVEPFLALFRVANKNLDGGGVLLRIGMVDDAKNRWWMDPPPTVVLQYKSNLKKILGQKKFFFGFFRATSNTVQKLPKKVVFLAVQM